MSETGHSISGEGDIRFERDGEAVLLARAHNERVVSTECLYVVDVAVVGFIEQFARNDFGFLPDSLKIVFEDIAIETSATQGVGCSDSVGGVRRSDHEHVTHAVKLHLVFHSDYEIARDFILRECPGHLDAPKNRE